MSVSTCEHSLFFCVSICTCGQSLVSGECVHVWAEFGIVLVRVHVNRVWNRVSVFLCGESLASCESLYMYTEFGIM